MVRAWYAHGTRIDRDGTRIGGDGMRIDADETRIPKKYRPTLTFEGPIRLNLSGPKINALFQEKVTTIIRRIDVT